MIKQLTTPKNGAHFLGSEYGNGYNYTVVYEAKDSDGLRDTCSFNFYVKVLKCNSPPYLSKGRRTCSHNGTFIRGSTCTHECEEGYERIGPSTITCQGGSSATWSGTATCQPLNCSQPANLENGRVECTDSRYQYQSICKYLCNTGYRLVGETFIHCTANRSWTQPYVSCEDDTPPTLSCISPQLFYADAKTMSTAVTWTLPIAYDSLDADPNVTMLEGPTPGAVISGTSYVKYTAVDDSGNKAPPCVIELRVQQIKCKHPTDTFNDTFIRFICDDDSYAFGTECNVSCLANYPLVGSKSVTCEKQSTPAGAVEGYWSWESETQPYCKQTTCPKLDPPYNGALVYDTVNLRPVYTMLCNEKYTIATKLGVNGQNVHFFGLFTCTDTGKWLPIDYVPDCTERRRPGRIGLLAEILYYSGDCTNEETQAEIIDIFQEILANVTELYQHICPSGESCAATDPTIVCGPVISKKKRYIDDGDVFHDLNKRQAATGAYYTLLKFVIEIAWDPPAEMSFDAALFYYDSIQAELMTSTKAKVADGWFLMDNAPILMTQADDPFTTAEYGDVMCDDGYILNVDECYACPIGHFLDEDFCSRCPLGSYSAVEGATICTPCNQGFSTKDVGSNSSSQCIALCLPGMFSPDGMEVCISCPMSTYQTSSGQTTCTPCPGNKYTETDGSTSADQCLDFDVYIGSSQEMLPLYETTDVTSDISMTLWIKPLTSSPAVTVQLSSRNGPFVTLAVSDETALNLGGTTISANRTFDSSNWNYMALLLIFSSNTVSVFINGNQVISKWPALSSDVVTSLIRERGTLTLSNTASSGIYVSGLHIQPAILTSGDIESQMTSCHVNSGNDVVGMATFKTQSIPGVTIIAPSVCDDTNECASSPCGSHICINEIGGYSCVCYGGFTGTNCETPPNYCIVNECKNGATCVSGDNGYACTCVIGYNGTFCEFEPVDGQWSFWPAWTVCNKTCDGTRTRSRSCDNPLPGPGGAYCTGDQSESEPCNGICPICPTLHRLSGTRKECSTNSETGNQVCTMFCLDGYQFPPGVNGSQEIYTCGPGTGYEWAPKQTTLACVTGYAPRRYSLSTSVQYDQEIPVSANKEVTSTIESKLTTTPCFNMTACSVVVEVERSRKRSIGCMLTMTFSISLQEMGDLDLPGFLQNGTVSGSLQEITDAITNLEETATYVENNVNELLDITVAGETYTVDSTSYQVEPIIDCANGQIPDSGVCVACPEGTYLSGSSCALCEKGTYQNISGQTSCIQCPPDFTTASIGSADSTQCSLENDAYEENAEHIPFSEDNNIVTIAVSISCSVLGLLFILVIIGVIFYLKKSHIRNPRVMSEVDLQSHRNDPAQSPARPSYRHAYSIRPSTAISLSRDVDLIFSLPPPSYKETEY